MIIKHFESLGFKRFRTEEFHDMICGRDDFNPNPLEKLAVKLGREHTLLYKDLELERVLEITLTKLERYWKHTPITA